MFQVKGGSVLSALLLQEKLYPHHNNLKPIHAHSWAGDCCWPITLIFPSGPRDMGMLLKQRLSESSLRSDAWSLEGNAVPPYERLTISNKKDVSMCPHLSIYICECSFVNCLTQMSVCLCINYIAWLNIMCLLPCQYIQTHDLKAIQSSDQGASQPTSTTC